MGKTEIYGAHGSVAELLERTCADINAAYERFCKDRAEIEERHKHDWMVRDHEMRVRHAQYIIETADLDRMRMSLVRNMATMNPTKPIAGINLDTN